jgi:hypothetical protein
MKNETTPSFISSVPIPCSDALIVITNIFLSKPACEYLWKNKRRELMKVINLLLDIQEVEKEAIREREDFRFLKSSLKYKLQQENKNEISIKDKVDLAGFV